MEEYYRILFNNGNYLAWAHGEFYLTHFKSYARLFTKKTLDNDEVKRSLEIINKAYIIEKIDKSEKIKNLFIYE